MQIFKTHISCWRHGLALLLCYSFSAFYTPIYAQKSVAEGLREVLEKTKDPKQRALLSLNISDALYKEDKCSPAAQYARDAVFFFSQNDHETNNLAQAMFVLSTALSGMDQYRASADTAIISAQLFDQIHIGYKKAMSLYTAGRSYMFLQQYDAAAKSFEQAFQYKTDLQQKSPQTEVELLTYMGSLAKIQHKPESAISLLMEAEKERALHQVIFPYLFYQLRLIYIERGEYAEALYWNKKAIDANRARHNDYDLSTYLTQLGEIYIEINDVNGATDAFNEAIVTAMRSGNKYALAEARLDLSDLYIREKKLAGMQSILADLEKSMKPSALNHISEYSYLKGAIYHLEGKIDSSIWWFDRSIKMAEHNIQTELSIVMTSQGDNYIALHRYEKALDFYRKALKLAQEDDFRTQEMGIWSKMAVAYEKIGNYRLALEAQRSEDTLAETILKKREKTYYNLAYLNLQTRTEKNQLEQQNLLFAKEKESLQFKIGWLSTAMAAIVLCLGTYFFYRKLKTQEKYTTKLKKESKQKIDTLKTINAALSHDLKNPALKAKYYLSQLKNKLNPAHYQAVKEEYLLIESNIDHFYLLINKLRSLYNFENMEIAAASFDANTVLADIKQELSPFIEKTNAAISQDSFPTIESDQLLFRQVLMNLVHNAVKFSSDGQQPLIHIAYEKQAGNHLIKVKDNGIGIPEKEQKNVFKLFRSARQREQYEGDGIGLALCKQIVEKLGGNIWIDSSSCHETIFAFTLPEHPLSYG